MSQSIKSELSVASTAEVKKQVEADLEIEDKEEIDLTPYMNMTKGGTRTQRLAQAKRLWEQDKKNKPQS